MPDATPLFDYIVAEAIQLGSGDRLGPLGSFFVAEMFIAVCGDTRRHGKTDRLANFLGVPEWQNQTRDSDVLMA